MSCCEASITLSSVSFGMLSRSLAMMLKRRPWKDKFQLMSLQQLNLDLFHTRPLETQIETIVGQWANFARLAVVANANDWHPSAFDHLDEFGYLERIKNVLYEQLKKTPALSALPLIPSTSSIISTCSTVRTGMCWPFAAALFGDFFLESELLKLVLKIKLKKANLAPVQQWNSLNFRLPLWRACNTSHSGCYSTAQRVSQWTICCAHPN